MKTFSNNVFEGIDWIHENLGKKPPLRSKRALVVLLYMMDSYTKGEDDKNRMFSNTDISCFFSIDEILAGMFPEQSEDSSFGSFNQWSSLVYRGYTYQNVFDKLVNAKVLVERKDNSRMPISIYALSEKVIRALRRREVARPKPSEVPAEKSMSKIEVEEPRYRQIVFTTHVLPFLIEMEVDAKRCTEISTFEVSPESDNWYISRSNTVKVGYAVSIMSNMGFLGDIEDFISSEVSPRFLEMYDKYRRTLS